MSPSLSETERRKALLHFALASVPGLAKHGLVDAGESLPGNAQQLCAKSVFHVETICVSNQHTRMYIYLYENIGISFCMQQYVYISSHL